MLKIISLSTFTLTLLTLSLSASYKPGIKVKIQDGFRQFKHKNLQRDTDKTTLYGPPQWKNAEPKVFSAEPDDAYFRPGDVAEKFSLDTLTGHLEYPGPVINASTPLLMHAYDPQSAFQQCLWQCEGRLRPLIITSPLNTHYAFFSYSEDAATELQWLKDKFHSEAQQLIANGIISQNDWDSLQPRLHYVITPVTKLGNWITSALSQWICKNHNCGLDQVRFESPDLEKPTVLKRLNARAYWLPFPYRTYKDRLFNVTYVGSGCSESDGILGRVALLREGNCSYADKIYHMESSGAAAVVVMADPGTLLIDMDCYGEECQWGLSTAAAMTEYDDKLVTAKHLTMRFQHTPYHSYYLALDGTGKLGEMGWFLYPSYDFMVWMAQWFNYRLSLTERLALDRKKVLSVMDESTMKGQPGAVGSIIMPAVGELSGYTRMELDMSLTCPGTRDVTCAHWDRTVRLIVCCDLSSPLCGLEIGRWISPYRRRIGRWLTDTTALFPLLDGAVCNFTMQTDSWSMPWKVTLNVLLSGYVNSTNKVQNPSAIRPFQMKKLYHSSYKFDKDYNKNFPPINFTIPLGTFKTTVVAVITGHGSDENKCAEFCVTSHHFVVNGNTAKKVFTNAGTGRGCAERVLDGVVPNEHGTWIYGRAGWCPGQHVTPWEIDITEWVSTISENTVHYYGYFNGSDPNPISNPGSMTIASYVVFYTNVN